MHRRRMLTSLGACALPVAGCLGESDSLSPGETYEAPDGTTVTVDGVRVRKSIRSTSVGSSAHFGVGCLAGHQFVVVDVEASDGDGNSMIDHPRLGLDGFGIEVDGVRYPRPEQHWYWAFSDGYKRQIDKPAVPVPVSRAESAAVVWRREDDATVRWDVADEPVSKLGAAPAFTVSSFKTPDSVGSGDAMVASFTVGNAGDRGGRFVAEFGAGDSHDYGEVTIDVPRGERRTHSERMEPYVEDRDDRFQVTLAWGCDRLDRLVTIAD